ncbi:hypothetical protein ACGTN6_14955 [Halomonas sp. THAF12]|uniref:Uncharacterized protein n=1 Tax=Halomonas organivorans TaxID=257772 RepID=A0A7W5BXP1_9GAMM|nr:hypothetical protein [Halomonas organivorans]MBB3141029.1 hypothetical protein [Halomonas organivorans]
MTTSTARPSLLKRIGKGAYRVLEVMTESAYRGFQARMPYAYI